MAEVEDGGGPLEQDPAREHGYHPTLESRPINKKVSRVSKRNIHRLERRANIHNPVASPVPACPVHACHGLAGAVLS